MMRAASILMFALLVTGCAAQMPSLRPSDAPPPPRYRAQRLYLLLPKDYRPDEQRRPPSWGETHRTHDEGWRDQEPLPERLAEILRDHLLAEQLFAQIEIVVDAPANPTPQWIQERFHDPEGLVLSSLLREAVADSGQSYAARYGSLFLGPIGAAIEGLRVKTARVSFLLTDLCLYDAALGRQLWRSEAGDTTFPPAHGYPDPYAQLGTATHAALRDLTRRLAGAALVFPSEPERLEQFLRSGPLLEAAGAIERHRRRESDTAHARYLAGLVAQLQSRPVEALALYAQATQGPRAPPEAAVLQYLLTASQDGQASIEMLDQAGAACGKAVSPAWPGPLIEMLRHQRDSDQLLMRCENDGQRAAIHFARGHEALARRDFDQARAELYEAGRAARPPDLYHRLAQADLALLAHFRGFHCPRCAQPHRGRLASCAACGFPLTGRARPCVFCGQALAPTETYCPHCRRRVLRRWLLPIGTSPRGLEEYVHVGDDSLLVRVPGGRYPIGSDQGPPTSAPRHEVDLREFLIAQQEVTRAQYAVFLADVQRTRDHRDCHRDEPAQHDHRPAGLAEIPPEADGALPVTGVDWFDAYAYAAWAGARLPTEIEWEAAARGRSDGPFPFGPDFEAHRLGKGLHNCGELAGLPAELGESPLGVADLAANAREWVQDFYDPMAYRRHAEGLLTGPLTGQERVVRGGSYLEARGPGAREAAQVFRRSSAPPHEGTQDRGFRIALDLEALGEQAARPDDPEAMRLFLRTLPASRHAQRARRYLRRLEFRLAEASGHPVAIEALLERYGDLPPEEALHAGEVLLRLRWQRVQERESPAALRVFARQHPDDSLARYALERHASLEDQSLRALGAAPTLVELERHGARFPASGGGDFAQRLEDARAALEQALTTAPDPAALEAAWDSAPTPLRELTWRPLLAAALRRLDAPARPPAKPDGCVGQADPILSGAQGPASGRIDSPALPSGFAGGLNQMPSQENGEPLRAPFQRRAWARMVAEAGADDLAEPLRAWLVEDDLEEVRAAAALALGRLGLAGDVTLLLTQLERESSTAVRVAAARALGRLGYSPAQRALLETAAHKGRPLELRLAAAEALGELGDESATGLLRALLGDFAQPPPLRAAAARALGGLRSHLAFEELRQAALAAHEGRLEEPPVPATAAQEELEVAALSALGGLHASLALRPLLRRIDELPVLPDEAGRNTALEALALADPDGALASAARVLDLSPDDGLRRRAALLLGEVRLDVERARARLEPHAKETGPVGEAVRLALLRLGRPLAPPEDLPQWFAFLPRERARAEFLSGRLAALEALLEDGLGGELSRRRELADLIGRIDGAPPYLVWSPLWKRRAQIAALRAFLRAAELEFDPQRGRYAAVKP